MTRRRCYPEHAASTAGSPTGPVRLLLSSCSLRRCCLCVCRCSFMPRASGGIGRTGSKHKKRRVAEPREARAGARTRAPAAPAATKAPATKTKEQKEPAATAAAEPETEPLRPATRSRIRKVRIVVDRPPKARRHPYRWTWGRKGSRMADWTQVNGPSHHVSAR